MSNVLAFAENCKTRRILRAWRAALVPDYLPTLGQLLDAFRCQYPGVALTVQGMANDEIAAAVEQNTLEAGLVMDLGTAAATLRRTTLTKDPFAIMVARRHPYWHRKSLSVTDLDAQRVLVPGLRPDQFAPLWQACRAAGAEPCFVLGESFYQVNYQVQEQGAMCINRLEVSTTGELDRVRDVPLTDMPPLSAAFLQPAGAVRPCTELLREVLLEGYRGASAQPPR